MAEVEVGVEGQAVGEVGEVPSLHHDPIRTWWLAVHLPCPA